MAQNQTTPPKNMKKARRSGYLSFDIGEVKRLSESNSPNAEAYGYLYQAVTTRPGTPKGIEDAYPQTAQETAQMQALLQKAKNARADKGDSYFLVLDDGNHLHAVHILDVAPPQVLHIPVVRCNT